MHAIRLFVNDLTNAQKVAIQIQGGDKNQRWLQLNGLAG
jgi:hypothetical protein